MGREEDWLQLTSSLLIPISPIFARKPHPSITSVSTVPSEKNLSNRPVWYGSTHWN